MPEMVKRSGIALVLALMLAFSGLCPALAEPEEEGALAIDVEEAALPEALEGGDFAVDLQADELQRFDVVTPFTLPITPNGVPAEGHVPHSNDQPLSNLPVIGTDVEAPSEGCVILGLAGRYVTDVTRALDRVNEIRREACLEGVDNPDNPGTPLTMDDYVPIRWSFDLEYIARIRAAESAISMGHQRLTDKGIFDLSSPSGVSSYAEVIAWNSTSDVVTGINQWYGEKADWDGKTGAVTGHYTSMISPHNHYIGLGTFCCEDAWFYNTTVGEFSGHVKYCTGGFDPYVPELDETPMAFSGDCIQLLEVKADMLRGGRLRGVMDGVGGDSSALALTVTVKGRPLLVTGGVSWSSSAPDIAAVDANGTVTALSCGVARITANAPGVTSDSADFTVNHLEQVIPAVAPSCTEPGLSEGVTCTVCNVVLAAQQPVPALGHAFGDWTVTQQSTLTQAGSRVRSCTRCGTQETEAIPTITPKLELSKASVKLAKTKNAGILVSVAEGDSFMAQSSDRKIAKVSIEGDRLIIKAQKTAGTAIITVRTGSGLKAAVTVTVSRAATKKLTCAAVTVKKGKKVTLKPKLTPTYSDDPITFKSNNKKIATVTAKGVVKGSRKGTTTITVQSGKKSVKVKVTVK